MSYKITCFKYSNFLINQTFELCNIALHNVCTDKMVILSMFCAQMARSYSCAQFQSYKKHKNAVTSTPEPQWTERTSNAQWGVCWLHVPSARTNVFTALVFAVTNYANYSAYSWGYDSGTLLKHSDDITGQAQKCGHVAGYQGQGY